jgi:hypothetical protein
MGALRLRPHGTIAHCTLLTPHRTSASAGKRREHFEEFCRTVTCSDIVRPGSRVWRFLLRSVGLDFRYRFQVSRPG